MSRTSWTVSWVVLCVACGDHGANQKATQAGSAASARSGATVAWKFDQFVDAPHHQLAVLFTDSAAALVDGSGKATPAIEVGQESITASGNGQFVVLASNETAYVLDAAGRQVATVPTFGGQGTRGSLSFANASEKGAGVYALGTGKPIYETKAPAKRVVFHPRDGFVFADAAQLWFVEEVTGKERWRQSIAALGDAALNAAPASLFVMHPDRTFEELDYAHGTLLAKGTCEGKPPSESGHDSPSRCAGYPDVDLRKDDAREPVRDRWGRGDYYPLRKGKDTFVVARDPVGRVRWSTAAPVPLEGFRGPVSTDADAGVLGFLAGKGDGARIVVLDDTSGKLLFQRDLHGDRLVGLTGPCWLAISAKHAACFDSRTGVMTWDVVTSGEQVDAWTLRDGEALLADGLPLTLSRVGKDGHRRWQVELPATHLEHASSPDKQASLWVDSQAWQLSDVVGIVEMKDGLTVLDLETGKLAKVH